MELLFGNSGLDEGMFGVFLVGEGFGMEDGFGIMGKV